MFYYAIILCSRFSFESMTVGVCMRAYYNCYFFLFFGKPIRECFAFKCVCKCVVLLCLPQHFLNIQHLNYYFIIIIIISALHTSNRIFLVHFYFILLPIFYADHCSSRLYFSKSPLSFIIDCMQINLHDL